MSQNNNKSVAYIVADIGGTNIRIAQTNKQNQLSQILTYQCAAFESLFDVLQEYLTTTALLNSEVHACLAIACPTDDDQIAMTNLPWRFSQKALKKSLSLSTLNFINDYTAIALAIPFLTENQKIKIGGGEPEAMKPISVCGPGTGLGMATLFPINSQNQTHWHCLNSEGGHIDFAPVDDIDMAILTYIKSLKNRVSYEQLLSGYGLEQIYCALLPMRHQPVLLNEVLCAADISKRAINNECEVCTLALLQFCKVLGSFAGNLALLGSSSGGVYIAGGIVPRFIDFLKQSDFRKRFEAKGRLSGLVTQVPTYVITEQQPGLLGASVFLNQQH